MKSFPHSSENAGEKISTLELWVSLPWFKPKLLLHPTAFSFFHFLKRKILLKKFFHTIIKK